MAGPLGKHADATDAGAWCAVLVCSGLSAKLADPSR
jgi:hypothetical protein